MPLPNTRVIPTGWEDHHAPVAEGGMTAACLITRQATEGQTPPFSQQTGRTRYPPPVEIYRGACEIERGPTQAAAHDIGSREVTVRQVVVSIPLSAQQPKVRDMVEVLEATDPQVVGLKFIVEEIRPGSLTWERDLLCSFWQPTAR